MCRVLDRVRRTVANYVAGALAQATIAAVTSYILLKILGVPFASEDVLADPAIREGIKRYSNWPTIPQVYIGGKFVGGRTPRKRRHSHLCCLG